MTAFDKAQGEPIAGDRTNDGNGIVEAFRKHYTATFAEHGPTSQGVDWGARTKVAVRYDKMLEVLEPGYLKGVGKASVLDVGCGYGGLLEHAKTKGMSLDYAGIDVVSEMVSHARKAHSDAKFHEGDVLTTDFDQTFDYVICNGILTLKLQASLREADAFAQRLIRKMFTLARRGIVFNTMSTYVDFIGPNGYHKSPVEMLAFCASELSPRLRLDHAYAPFEYAIFVYRPL